MKFNDKTKKIVCLIVAISLIIPLAISMISMFIAK